MTLSKYHIIDNWVITWKLSQLPYSGESLTQWDGTVLINHPEFRVPRTFFLVAETREESINHIYKWIHDVVLEMVNDIEYEQLAKDRTQT